MIEARLLSILAASVGTLACMSADGPSIEESVATPRSPATPCPRPQVRTTKLANSDWRGLAEPDQEQYMILRPVTPPRLAGLDPTTTGRI